MFAHSYSKLSRTCYGKSTQYALQKSSVLRWLQKQDDDDDEEKSRTAAGREFQAAGPQQADRQYFFDAASATHGR